MRDSGCDVVVGLPAGSKSREKAIADGLRVATPADAAQQADVIMILIPDQHHREVFERDIKPALAPGKMVDDTIREIERKPVRYLLWSNRTYPDFQTPVFGVDFDVPLGDYFRANYHPVGPLMPNTAAGTKWRATIWERNSTKTAK